MLDKTCFMIISDDAKYLQRILSSKLFEYAYKRIFSSIELGVNGYQYNKHAFIKLPIIRPDENTRAIINDSPLDKIDDILKRLYEITEDEYITLL